MKPRDQWDREDLLDYLDGWQSECGLGFKSERNRDRVTSTSQGDGVRFIASREYMTEGAADRIRHREATGL